MGKNIITKMKTPNTASSFSDSSPSKKIKEDEEMHWEVVQRILFIYCKTNRAHSYVQGMNEIIGPLYYVFASDPLENTRSKLLILILSAYENVSFYFPLSLNNRKCGVRHVLLFHRNHEGRSATVHKEPRFRSPVWN